MFDLLTTIGAVLLIIGGVLWMFIMAVFAVLVKVITNPYVLAFAAFLLVYCRWVS